MRSARGSGYRLKVRRAELLPRSEAPHGEPTRARASCAQSRLRAHTARPRARTAATMPLAGSISPQSLRLDGGARSPFRTGVAELGGGVPARLSTRAQSAWEPWRQAPREGRGGVLCVILQRVRANSDARRAHLSVWVTNSLRKPSDVRHVGQVDSRPGRHEDARERRSPTERARGR